MESNIQKNIIKKSEKLGWYVVKIIQCNKPGFPDLQLMKDGMVIFIEVKDKGKKARPLQLYRHNQLKLLGFKVFVIDNADDILDIIHSSN